MIYTSLFCLSWLFLVSSYLIFSKDYQDNWAQQLGLIGLAIWAAIQEWKLVEGLIYSSPETSLSFPQDISHFSLSLFLTGTAYKKYCSSKETETFSPHKPFLM